MCLFPWAAADSNSRLARMHALQLWLRVCRHAWTLENTMNRVTILKYNFQADPVIRIDALCPKSSPMLPVSYLPDLTRFFLLVWKATNKTPCSNHQAPSATWPFSVSKSTLWHLHSISCDCDFPFCVWIYCTIFSGASFSYFLVWVFVIRPTYIFNWN